MKKINTDVLIVGAGPVGLFTVFELGQLGMKSCIVDSLEDIGGQCTALYPDKPIYDIPAYPSLTAGDLIVNLKKQIDPFKPTLLMNQKVVELEKCDEFYNVKTSENNIILAKCIKQLLEMELSALTNPQLKISTPTKIKPFFTM